MVELLVAVVILGIITAISLPLIRNIQEANERRKFTTYSEMIENSAKLYVDSYSEDMFGHKDGGCAYVTWNQLFEKELTKDIQIADISCNSKNTFVKVVKYKDNYNYYPSLGCGNKKNGAVSKVTITLPDRNKAQEIDEESCGGPNNSSMTITASPDTYTKKDRKKVGIEIKITSPTGIATQKIISYAWSKTNAYSDSLDWKQLDISIPSEGDQENKIISGKTITVTSKQIVTPANQTGDYYLIIKIDALSDLFGTPWNEGETDKKNYVTFGKYRIDNTIPIINSLKIESTTKNYNNINTKVTVNATDNNQLSQTDELKMCVSTSETGCSSASNYQKYTTTTNFKVSNSFDGKEKTVYVSMKDMAGNIAKKSIKYTVYKECTITKTDGNWKDKTTCTVKCGGGTKQQESGSLDSNTGAKCTEKKTQPIACNTQECCGSNKEVISTGTWGNCSKACGGGKKKRTITYASKFDHSISCGTAEEEENCNTRECCGSNKVVISYGTWGACNKTCGGGTRSRTNTYASKFDHSITCGTESEVETCNTQVCCSGDKVQSYGTFKCNASCGNGVNVRTNTWVRCDGTTYQKEETGTACKIKDCPPTCSISLSGTAGNEGWYRSNVAVNLIVNGTTTAKGLSTSKNSTNGKTSITDTTNGKTTYYGYVKNSGGTNSCQATVKIDKTAPTLTQTSPKTICTNQTYPGTSRIYPTTVTSFNWSDSGGSGMKEVYMIYKFNYKGTNKCSYFRADQSGSSSNNGIWIKFGGSSKWKVKVCDHAGNCTSKTGTANCTRTTILKKFSDGASYISTSDAQCNF